MTASSLLVLGGARSGKSCFALAAAGRPGVFVATAEPCDADMARRIERHRRERGAAWRTVEEPLDLAGALGGLVQQREPVVVDCLTLWVGNRQLRGDSDDAVLADADRVVALVGRRAFEPLVLVSNEVGEGVHPETDAGRRFRDLLGMVNQRLAAAVDRVVLMVAGVPLTIKDQRVAAHADARPAP